MAAAGRLHRLHQGVYTADQSQVGWHAHCLAAVLAAAPACASHVSAGWLWGLLRTQPATIHVTAATRRRLKRPFVVHYADLSAVDRSVQRDIPVTSLARTLLDLAGMLSPARVDRILERAEELGLFDLGPVEELLGRAGGHCGAAKLRRALAVYRAEPAFTRSRVEKSFLAQVRRAGLPVPAMNYTVAGFELDAYWKAERFVVELDVYETHGSRAAFERDRLRQEDLKLLGIEMTRVTGTRLKREPKKVMRRVAALLAQRRAQLN